MKKSMETKQWCQQLRRSVALALLVSGGAAAVLPGTAGATAPWDAGVSGKESIVTSADKEVTSAAVSGGELTLTSDAANVRGGYSYALSTYATDATGAATSGDANGNTLQLGSTARHGSLEVCHWQGPREQPQRQLAMPWGILLRYREARTMILVADRVRLIA